MITWLGCLPLTPLISFTWEPSKGSHTLPRWRAAGEAGGLPTRPFTSSSGAQLCRCLDSP